MSGLVIEDTAPLLLRIESIAADVPPDNAVKHMCRVATRIGITVQCEINGVSVYIHPGSDENLAAENYVRAVRDNKTRMYFYSNEEGSNVVL